MGSDLTVRRLKEIKNKISPDILFLMETKNQDEAVFKHFRGSAYTNHYTVPPIGLSGGLALSWTDNVHVDVLYSSQNIIDTHVQFNGKSCFVSYVYGAPQKENRTLFWEKLSEIGDARTEAWLITGDFNDLLDNSEKLGGPARWEGSFLAFRSFVTQNGIWDLQHFGNAFSWRGTRYNHFIQSRLDRAMANVTWSELFPAGRCEYLRFEGSDHRPVLTYFDQNLTKKRGSFRFDRRLCSKPEIRTLIDDTWKSSGEDSLLTKINRVRIKLVEWTKAQNATSKAQVLNLQNVLEAELSRTTPDQASIDDLKAQLLECYEEEENFWRQRSRIQWLNSGDRNSSFFHAVTRGRRAQNRFSVIENAAGLAFYKEGEIVNTIADYYRDLFASSSTGQLQVVQEVISSRVTPEMNEALIALPDDQEIKAAVFAIHADKAPGPDGFSAGFYQSFWDIIGDDVSKEIRNFFASGSLRNRQNETHVRLIPKGLGPKRVSDYRPIALCNTQYKIVAKILTKRLQPMLDRLISVHQSAFVPKRAISDNVLITHEILHYLRTSGARVRCAMAIKTDMSKAYDMIEWDFLREVLERFGFHEIWIGWIMECVCTVSYSFLINGAPQGFVLPTRGLRQGDPLSPYLFILCTEVLSGLCLQAQANGSLQGVKVARNCPPINHLLFADDTMFFCRSNVTSCTTFLSILSRYEQASGQCINKAKSSITFSAKTRPEVKARVREALDISNDGGMGKYLGLPEHFGRKKRDIFASIVDRIRQRSHSWSTRYLSSAGKLVLLKTVLAAMPSYAMSCFKLPKSLCKQIQSAMTRFWWDSSPAVKKLCWVAWERLTLPKSAGGLGFRDIEVFNDALLAKLSWRLLQSPDSLLGQTLLGKYCHSISFLDCPIPSSASHGWRGILAGREVLKLGLGWVVGDGKNINVWKDPWLSTSSPLRPIGPPCADNKTLRVIDLISPVSLDWDVTAIRTHLPQYEDTIRKLVPSQMDMADSLQWLPEKSGNYSTRSGYALAKLQASPDLPSPSFAWKRNVWNLQCSPKLNLFLWKAASGALPVGSALSRRGMTSDTACKRCGAVESEIHVLLHCPFAAKVWDLTPSLSKPSPSINTVPLLLQACSKSVNLPPTELCSPLFPWILWNLWT